MGSFVNKLRGIFSRKSVSPEDAAEAQRLRAEMDNVRLSQTKGAGSAGQNYQSGRGHADGRASDVLREHRQ